MGGTCAVVLLFGCGRLGFDISPATVAQDGGLDAESADSAVDSDTGDGGPGDSRADGGGEDPGLLSESFGPLLRYEFEGSGPVTLVTDRSARTPSVSLEPGGFFPTQIAYEAGAVKLSGARLEASLADSLAIRDALLAAGSFTFEVWTSTDVFTQLGPARIVTLSVDSAERAFTLGQTAGAVSLRIRSTVTDANATTVESFAPAFSDSATHHIVCTFAASTGRQRIFVDGVLVALEIHTDGSSVGNVSNWVDTSYLFGFGAEFNNQDRWVGSLHRFALYDEVLADEDIERLFRAGP